MCFLVQLVLCYHEKTSEHYDALMEGTTELHEIITERYVFKVDIQLRIKMTSDIKEVTKTQKLNRDRIFNANHVRDSNSKKGSKKKPMFNKKSSSKRDKAFGFKYTPPKTIIVPNYYNEVSFTSQVMFIQ